MPRMIVLNAAERQIYETPPILDVSQRVRAFDVPAGLLGMAKALRKPAHQIGFLVSCAYFGMAKRFFAPKDYHARDIRYAASQLDLPAAFTAADYPVRILYGQWIHVPLRRWNRAPKKGGAGIFCGQQADTGFRLRTSHAAPSHGATLGFGIS